MTDLAGIFRLGCESILSSCFFFFLGLENGRDVSVDFSFFFARLFTFKERLLRKTLNSCCFLFEPAEVIVDIFLVLIPFCAFFWPVPSFSFGHSPAPNQPSPTASDLPNNNPPPLPDPPRLRLPLVTQRLIQICFLASLLTTSTAITFMIVLFQVKDSPSQEIQARIGYMAFVLSHLTVSSSFFHLFNSKSAC